MIIYFILTNLAFARVIEINVEYKKIKLQNVKVTIQDVTVNTDKKGKAIFDLEGKDFLVKIRAEGFEPKGLITDESKTIELEPIFSSVSGLVIYNAEPVKEVKIKVKNNFTNEVFYINSDDTGGFSLRIPVNQSHNFEVKHPNYSIYSENLTIYKNSLKEIYLKSKFFKLIIKAENQKYAFVDGKTIILDKNGFGTAFLDVKDNKIVNIFINDQLYKIAINKEKRTHLFSLT